MRMLRILFTSNLIMHLVCIRRVAPWLLIDTIPSASVDAANIRTRFPYGNVIFNQCYWFYRNPTGSIIKSFLRLSTIVPNGCAPRANERFLPLQYYTRWLTEAWFKGDAPLLSILSWNLVKSTFQVRSTDFCIRLKTCITAHSRFDKHL